MILISNADAKGSTRHGVLSVLFPGTIFNAISCTKRIMGDYPTPLAKAAETEAMKQCYGTISQPLYNQSLPSCFVLIGGLVLKP